VCLHKTWWKSVPGFWIPGRRKWFLPLFSSHPIFGNSHSFQGQPLPTEAFYFFLKFLQSLSDPLPFTQPSTVRLSFGYKRKVLEVIMDPHSIFQMPLPITQEPTQSPSYMSVWPIEFSFQLAPWKIWFHSNWALSMYLSLVYLLIIFSVQLCMQVRKPFSLRQPLLYWNLFLAGFSILGTFRTAPELFHVFQTQSPWYTSICSR